MKTIDNLYENDLLPRFEVFLIKKLMFSEIINKFYLTLDKELNIDSDIENRTCWIALKIRCSEFIRTFMYIKNNDVYKIEYFILFYSSKVLLLIFHLAFNMS